MVKNKKTSNAKRWITKEWKRHKWLYFMVLPGLLVLIIFSYVPMYGILIAFKNYKVNLGILKSPWVGLKYFRTFFSNPTALRTIRNTLLLGLYSLLWSFPVPILLTILFNELAFPRFKKVVQTVSYYPNFVSTVIIVGMLMTFSMSDGLFNQLLSVIGKGPYNLMGEPQYFRSMFIASGIWQSAGYGTIIYLAALSNIDPTLYDAAEIDGANRLQKNWHITLPGLKSTIVIMLLFAIGGMFNADTQKTLLMYSPSVYETADNIGTYVYREGIQGAQFEYTTAIGLFQTGVNFIFLIVANYFSKKLADESLF